MLALAACGTESTTATPAAPATATTTAQAAADTGNDKEVCTAAEEAKKAMVKALTAALTEEADPGAISKVLTDYEKSVSAAVAGAGDSAVTSAAKATAAAAAAAAADSDPLAATDKPDFAKPGTDLAAACKAAGVTVSF
ncbi:MAG TPA: hypothetical protein VFO77_02655 [Actinoplanes sp.]|nr:hypothetical protein [Actinoplanes sp.]